MKQQMISFKTKVFPAVTPKGKQMSPKKTKPTSSSFPKYHLKRESPWVLLKKLEEEEKRLQQMLETNMKNCPHVNIQNTKTLQDLKKVQTNSTMLTKNRPSKKVISKPVPMGYRHIHMHPDEAFFSGAWLFNMSSAPLWFQIEAQKKTQVITLHFKAAPVKPKKAFSKGQAPIYNPVIAHEEINSVLDEENVFALVTWLKCLNQVDDGEAHSETMRTFKKNIISEHPLYPNSRENHRQNYQMVTSQCLTKPRKPQQMGEEYTNNQSVQLQKYHLDDVIYSGAWLIQRQLQLGCIFPW